MGEALPKGRCGCRLEGPMDVFEVRISHAGQTVSVRVALFAAHPMLIVSTIGFPTFKNSDVTYSTKRSFPSLWDLEPEIGQPQEVEVGVLPPAASDGPPRGDPPGAKGPRRSWWGPPEAFPHSPRKHQTVKDTSAYPFPPPGRTWVGPAGAVSLGLGLSDPEGARDRVRFHPFGRSPRGIP